MTKTFLFVH